MQLRCLIRVVQQYTAEASRPVSGAQVIARWLLPTNVDPVVLPLLLGKALRAFADGYVAVLLPAYLLALGFGTLDVGILSTATLLGSALATLAVGVWGNRFHHRRLLLGAALLMLGTGLSFACSSAFWPLLLVAFVGTLNPSSGDVSVFLPLEHARLAESSHGAGRTALFARYALLGALFAALSALASGAPTAVGDDDGVRTTPGIPGDVLALRTGWRRGMASV